MNNLSALITELCPNGVDHKSLGELGNFYGGLGGKSKEDFVDGNEKFITYKNVYSNPALQIDVDDKVKISDGEKQNLLQYGDVIFTGSSETLDECGFSSVITVKTDEKLYLNSFCFFLRFNDSNIIFPDFSKHLFRSDALRQQIKKAASGTTRYNVSKEKMKKVVIPIPPLEVQHEIVRILDSFTAFTSELTENLSKEFTARKQQYAYYRDKLLTFESRTTWHSLDDLIISLNTGLNPRQFFKLNTEDAHNYYVTIREIQNGTIVISDKTDKINDEALLLCNNRSHLEVGDVLFSGTGTIGETAVITEPPTNWNIKEGVYAIKPRKDRLNSRYLMYILRTDAMRAAISKKVAGGTVKSIPMGEMRKLQIPVPTLDVQNRLVSVLDNFDAICTDLNIGLPAEIEARKKQYEYYRDKLLSFTPAD